MIMTFRNLTLAASLAAMLSCTASPSRQQARAFATPEEAVKALTDAVKAKRPEALTAVFGSEAQDLIDAGDPGAGQRARTVFKVAVAERWHLEDRGADKVLVIGNEDWPFPIPLVKSADGWRFDTAKGREEVLNRQVGRNEFGAIKVARTYVFAQRLYAKSGHDGKPAGLFARTFRSDPGKQNGLYWVAARGQRPSPLGDLVAEAAAEGRTVDKSRASPALSRLLLPDPDRPERGRARRGEELPPERRSCGRVRSRRVAGPVRRDGSDDVRDQPGRPALSEGSRTRHRQDRPGPHDLRSGLDVDPGAVAVRLSRRSRGFAHEEDAVARSEEFTGAEVRRGAECRVAR